MNHLWTTPENWQGGEIPDATGVVHFGTGYSANSPDLNGSWEIAGMEFTNTDNLSITNSSPSGALTLTGAINRTVPSGSFSFVTFGSKIILGADIGVGINTSIAGSGFMFNGPIEGNHKITLSSTGTNRSTVSFSGNNALWTGGMRIGDAPVNSLVQVLTNGALGKGQIEWTGNTILRFAGMGTHTIDNNFQITGGAGKGLVVGYESSNTIFDFKGSITGALGQTNGFYITNSSGANNTIRLSAANSDAGGGRMIFAGSLTGGVTRAAHNNALGWTTVLGQSNTNGDHVLYVEDGTHLTGANIAMNDDVGVAGEDKLKGAFVLGSDTVGGGSSVNGTIGLSKFSVAGYHRTLTLTAAQDGRFTVKSLVSDHSQLNLSIEKKGQGTVVLENGNNTYKGTTTVEAGTLLANNASGSATGYGALTVKTGATLGGTGIIRPRNGNGVIFEEGAILNAGDNGLGTLTFDLQNTTGNIIFEEGALLDFDLKEGESSDRLAFINLGASGQRIVFNDNEVTLSFTSPLQQGVYQLISFNRANAYTGTLRLGNLADVASIVYLSDGVELHVVPEPETWVLLGVGAFLPLLVRRKRRG